MLVITMTKLISNEVYIYKKENGITYSKLQNAGEDQWSEIGRDYSMETIKEIKIWNQIVYDSANDSALKKELDRVKMMYLSKQKSPKIN